jgi:hypothetical protein
MPDKLEFRGSFKASDRDGNLYLIDVFQVQHDGSQAAADDSVLYRTADGQAVKRIRQGVYEIIESQIALQWFEPERA